MKRNWSFSAFQCIEAWMWTYSGFRDFGMWLEAPVRLASSWSSLDSRTTQRDHLTTKWYSLRDWFVPNRPLVWTPAAWRIRNAAQAAHNPPHLHRHVLQPQAKSPAKSDATFSLEHFSLNEWRVWPALSIYSRCYHTGTEVTQLIAGASKQNSNGDDASLVFD